MAYFIENVKFSPFKDAEKLRITSGYGNRTITINGKEDNSFHDGLDINNQEQEQICSFADGKVIELVNNRDGYSNTRGNYVIIQHDKGKSIYQHLKYGSICVNVGDMVKQNQTIGIKGKTGYVTGVHLHFGIKIGNNWVDPTPYVKGKKLINNSKIPLPTPILKNEETEQIEVLITNLRCRTNPNIDKNNVIGFVPLGYYNLISKYDDGTYIWYQIEDGKWVADNATGEWIRVYDKIVLEEKEEELTTSQNEPVLETKEEEYDYGMRQEENNPLLWFFDWLFNLIKKIFKK